MVQYVPSKLQIADVLTKALSVAQFLELKGKLNVVAMTSPEIEAEAQIKR